ncbi:MAG: 2-dehydropantoate 2-reductase [Anaerolineales bacterium]|nr:2-dehydropantoate 2-reductase [Anaerolineales bacterium]
MQAIQRITVLGAGALGMLYATKFHAADFDVELVASGERAVRLRQGGIIVNGARYDFPVTTPEIAAPSDLIIVALKHHHMPAAVPLLENFIGPETLIISVMNGIVSEDILAAQYGWEHVLYCVAVGMDAVREGNSTAYATPGKLLIGEAQNDDISPRLRRLQAALDRVRLPHETPTDMLRALWWKFMVNVGANQASAVMNATYAMLRDNHDACTLMETLMREAITLAEHLGIDLHEDAIAEWHPFLNKLSADGKTSMLQDIEAGRKTEVELFAGTVVDLGQKHNLPTPVNQTLLQIIRVLETSPENRQPT